MIKYPYFDGTQLCTQADASLFFPERGENNKSQEAKAICASCHFEKACADYAVHFEIRGIWGGTTEQERRLIAKRKGIKRQTLTPLDMIRDLSMTPEAQAKRRERASIESHAQGAA